MRFAPLLLLIIAGCATPLKVGVIDATPREPNTGDFEVFRDGEKPVREFREIAALTYDADFRDEAEAIGAMSQRARQMGANGLIIGRTDKPFQGAFVPPIMWRAQGNRSFNASAFVYLKNQPTP